MKKAVLILLPLLAIGGYLAHPYLRHHWALHKLQQRGVELEVPKNTAPEAAKRLAEQKLLSAACQAAPDLLGLLLDAGFDPNASFEDGMTALHCAAMGGRLAQAQWLLAHGARPNPRMKAGSGMGDETRLEPMHLAAAWHHLPVVELLQRQGVSIDAPSEAGPPLMIALAFRWNERFAPPKGRLPNEPDLLAVYRQFRRLGARTDGVDGQGNTLLHLAMRTRQQPLIEEMLASGDFDLNAANLEGETPFMQHIRRGHGPADPAAAAADLAMIGRMIDLGAQVNVRSRQGFAVILASAFWPELFDLLVERGADPFIAQSGGRSLWTELTHAPSPEVIALADRMPTLQPPREADGKPGNGPLHVFAREPRPDLVAYFLKRGLSPDEADGAGDTPIHEALATSGGAYPHRDRTIAVLRLLLDAGANPNARNQASEPPLMRACGHPPELLQLLLAKGADVNAVTQWNGKTRHVLDCFAEQHNLEGFALLMRAGASKGKQ